MNCPGTGVITAVTFANFGTPNTATCGAYAAGGCSSDVTALINTQFCPPGGSSCFIPQLSRYYYDNVFGDNCYMTFKTLAVQMTCTAAAPASSTPQPWFAPVISSPKSSICGGRGLQLLGVGACGRTHAAAVPHTTALIK